MTRYPNPFAAVVELIARAFAPLAHRDYAAGRHAFVVLRPHSRARDLSTSQAPRAKATSTPHGAEQGARPIEKSETMQHRRHTDPR